jgi:hypothetical protein
LHYVFGRLEAAKDWSPIPQLFLSIRPAVDGRTNCCGPGSLFSEYFHRLNRYRTCCWNKTGTYRNERQAGNC